jgi:hypothetical protein
MWSQATSASSSSAGLEGRADEEALASHVVDLSDGARRWRFGTIRYGSPVVSGGRLYASGGTSANGQVIEVVDEFRLVTAAAGTPG